MKRVGIKKKYLVGLFTLLSGSLGLLLVQDAIRWVAQNGIGALIIPAVFVVSVMYVFNYWRDFHLRVKLAEEAAKEVAEGDAGKEDAVRDHLIRKLENEAYTFNFLYGKIKITDSWDKQKEIDELKTNKHIPDVVKKEFV